MTMRGRDAPAGAYSFGRFRLEPDRQLVAGGEPVAIGGKALRLLSLLARAEGGIVTKDELMAKVWPDVIVEENAIQVHLSAARKALGEEGHRLVAVRGLGYRLGVGGGSGVADHRQSLAVLAFVNLTGDPGKTYLGEGIAEELITTLSRSSDLRVAARTSSFAYRGRDLDVRTIASDLGVDMVLEGSVRSAGDRIRVTAQLIEAKSGSHLWAQGFERPLDDLLALEDELAAAIARVLKARIAGLSRPGDPIAYELYLQARGLAAHMSRPSIEKSVELHKQAIARDPGFARGWAALAGTLMVGAIVGLLPIDRRAEARVAADQALSLDPGAAAAHAIRASLDATAGAWIAAAQGFEQAIELDPDDPAVLEAVGFALWAPAGRFAKAASLLQRAVELAPAAPNFRLSQAFHSVLRGDRDSARLHLEMAGLLGVNVERSMFNVVAADLAIADANPDRAAAAYAAALAEAPELAGLAIAETVSLACSALVGATAAAPAVAAIVSLVDEVERRGRHWLSPGAAGHFVRWLSWLGADDDAMTLLNRMAAAWQKTGHLATASLAQLWRPDMAPLRAHPAFPSLVGTLGFEVLWARYGGPDVEDWVPVPGSPSGPVHHVTLG